MKQQVLSAIYRAARAAGRGLPVPVSWKLRARNALLRLQYPGYWRGRGAAGRYKRALGLGGSGGLGKRGRRARGGKSGAGKLGRGGAGERAAMRAACCGLEPGLVTVVLPVYNQADLLEEAVESVLAQTCRDFELILINDGSEDDVDPILERYSRHPASVARIRCFTQSNQGLPKALSNGFQLARGEFWTWTSADNLMEPRMLERLRAKLQSEPELGMTYADYYAIDDRGELLQDETWRWLNRPDPASGAIRLPRAARDLNIVQDNFIGPCFMYRGWIGRALGDYAPQTGVEDYDYWMRINAFFPVRHLGSDELLYRYRVHDNTLSARAADFSIADKVGELMMRERERAARFQSKLKVAADAAGMEWLRGHGAGNARLLPACDAHGRLAPHGATDAELALLSSETALRNLSALAAQTPLAVLFENGGGLSDEHRALIRQLPLQNGCIALAPDAQTAADIRQTADIPVLDAASPQSPHCLAAFAKNRRHFHQTWPASQSRRQLPRAIVPSPPPRPFISSPPAPTQPSIPNPPPQPFTPSPQSSAPTPPSQGAHPQSAAAN